MSKIELKVLPKCIAIIAILVLMDSCASKTPGYKKDTGEEKMYKGVLNIDAAMGFESILKQQIEVFQFFHDSVTVNVNYKNEPEMFSDFISKKATLLLLSRELTKEETDNLQNHDTIFVRELPVAYDAVALIGNKRFNDDNLSADVLKQIFENKGPSVGATHMVFNKQDQGVVKYVLAYLGNSGKVASNVYGLNSVDEVITYIEGDDHAIGFIPYNFVSDTDDERVKKILERIKILSLHAKNEKGEDVRVSANQSDIAAGTYPLTRTMNTVIRFNSEDNLEKLFMNFLYQSKGAKIFLKAGLIPARMPEREINVNTEGVKTN